MKDGCDGVAFDAAAKTIFTSNGKSGTLSVIKEKDANDYLSLGEYKTQRGARTLALETDGKTIFLPTADFDQHVTVNGRPKIKPGSFKILVVQQ